MRILSKSVKLKIFAGCLLFLSGLGCVQAQTPIKVTLLDNTEQTYDVDASGKFWYNSNNLVINVNSAAAAVTIPLATIRKITFTNGNTTGVNDVVNPKASISIYPNPASNYFDIKSSEKTKLDVRVFNTNGKMVLSDIYQNDSRVDIAQLSAGVYIVVINNQSFKIVKQ